MEKFLSRTRYFLGEALQGFVRQKSLTAATLVSTTASLMVFGIVLLVTANVELVSARLEQRKGIVAFIEDGVSNSQMDFMRQQMAAQAEVESVAFVSKEEALEQFRKSLGEDQVLDALGSNPLPASFEVKLKAGQGDAEAMERVAAFIGSLKGIEEVSYGGPWALRLDRLLKSLTVLNVIVGAVVGLAVAFVVANVVRLAVLARKEGIAIMRVVGATSHFVRAPFLLEGLFHTILSALVALGLLYAVHRVFTQRLPDITFLSPTLMGVFILVGVGAGMVGTFLTLHEVLREEWA
ncbi:MAG: ABC transporter permease [Candidatus Eisenbacteria bacterium]|nr:ABC transporter permease [Candidatus Eisenbacteria bacterium]